MYFEGELPLQQETENHKSEKDESESVYLFHSYDFLLSALHDLLLSYMFAQSIGTPCTYLSGISGIQSDSASGFSRKEYFSMQK